MDLLRYPRAAARLDGVRVLVVDDEILIALDIEATFLEAGAEAVILCLTLSEALSAAAAENLSVATLDVRLGRETSEAVAALLYERGIPFIFYSGQSLPGLIRDKWPLSRVVAKPAEPRQLVEAVVDLIR